VKLSKLYILLIVFNKMKHVVSISLSEETIFKIREKLRSDKTFRSKSHLVEDALREFLGEKE